jgi:uncharacterized protein DUF3485
MNHDITTITESTTPSRGSSPLRAFRHSGFLISAAILLIAAIGLNASVAKMKLHFKKESVPLRKSFAGTEPIPVILGPWVQVAREEVLDADMLASLATNEFLFCHYIDSSKFSKTPQQIQKDFAGKTLKQQRDDVERLIHERPAGVIQFYLTHYTGKADTVAHIPERCYVGSGFDPLNPESDTWNIAGHPLPVRHITFQHQTASQRACDVVYFFHTNGHYESDSLKVRATLQDLLARYGYYTKAELMCGTAKRELSEPAMKDFLGRVLPSLEAALPDWNQYKVK